ncbi:hypothetical protein G5B46_01745 [Caulobacter sp. 602-2]|uniref:Uncharacterized protein n=1 Tax=Caulobacter sp. 602-2 TaxID=2710887 RepID=A0A6G4QS01_9CAUL|nr:hypothetical protein [Caulobacter sp. 602-2]NGM48321.1 hypothetical protein [Caulobacter sp. 602-2]
MTPPAVCESGKPLAALKTAEVSLEHGRVTVKVGSGDYDFRVKPKA